VDGIIIDFFSNVKSILKEFENLSKEAINKGFIASSKILKLN